METDIHLEPAIGGKGDTRSTDAVIARLAARQQGVVSRAQLLTLGLSPRAIDHRIRCGRLHVVHRGVYAVGHPVLSRQGWWMAAVLAAGEGAVLSHRSAAALWGVRGNGGARVDVTVPRNRKKRSAIDIHRSVLPSDEVTLHHGIPVTTPTRTLLDLAEILDFHQLETAVHQTEYRRLTSSLPLDALLTRHQGRRGTAALTKIVDQGRLGTTITRSELETEFLAFLDAHAVSRPLVNERVGPYTVDGLYPEHRLVVELDSRAAHQTTKALESDRKRDRDLLTNGYRVVRITWRQLHEDGPTIAAQLRALTAPRQARAPTPAARARAASPGR